MQIEAAPEMAALLPRLLRTVDELRNMCALLGRPFAYGVDAEGDGLNLLARIDAAKGG